VARIEGVPENRASLLTRIGYWFARRKVGDLPRPLPIYAHNPWIMRAYGTFELLSERATLADKRLKILASIKTGTIVGCPW
jgi:hypothetical protein